MYTNICFLRAHGSNSPRTHTVIFHVDASVREWDREQRVVFYCRFVVDGLCVSYTINIDLFEHRSVYWILLCASHSTSFYPILVILPSQPWEMPEKVYTLTPNIQSNENEEKAKKNTQKSREYLIEFYIRYFLLVETTYTHTHTYYEVTCVRFLSFEQINMYRKRIEWWKRKIVHGKQPPNSINEQRQSSWINNFGTFQSRGNCVYGCKKCCVISVGRCLSLTLCLRFIGDHRTRNEAKNFASVLLDYLFEAMSVFLFVFLLGCPTWKWHQWFDWL